MENITAESLRRAASIKDQIEALEVQYAAIMAGNAPRRGRKPGIKLKNEPAMIEAPVVKQPRKKRKMSPEGRAAIIAAQKARWAKVKK